jgi:hypothetical protein
VPYDTTNVRSLSTTSWPRDGSLATAAGRRMDSASGASSPWSLRVRDRRRSLDLQISYVGGSEGRWQIVTRGLRWLFPGDLSVADVMAWINRDQP